MYFRKGSAPQPSQKSILGQTVSNYRPQLFTYFLERIIFLRWHSFIHFSEDKFMGNSGHISETNYEKLKRRDSKIFESVSENIWKGHFIIRKISNHNNLCVSCHGGRHHTDIQILPSSAGSWEAGWSIKKHRRWKQISGLSVIKFKFGKSAGPSKYQFSHL